MLLVVLSLSACDDYFELERPPQNPWTTIEEFERAPIGAYGVLFGSHEWVQAWSNYAVIITSLGDDVAWVNDNKWGYWRHTPEGSDRTEMTDRNIWLLYRGIGAVNAALDFVEENNGNPYPDLTDEEIKNGLNRIVGELHFLRGFCYFMLHTTFGHAYVPGGDNSTPDLPLHKHYVSSADEAVNPEIATTGEMWEFIRDEFAKAKSLLPPHYDPSLHDPSYEVRANQFAAAAMLMRTHFQMGAYDQAEDEASFIIEQNNGAYDLTEDPIEAFNKSGYAERGRETIFYISYGDKTLFPDNHLSVLNATWDGAPCVWNETRMADHIIKNLNWMNDPATETTFRTEALRDKRFQQLIKIRYPKAKAMAGQEVDPREEVDKITTVWPWKYYRGPGEDYTNVPIVRLAEIYLTRSVIRLMKGDKQGAADDLNLVKARAWDTAVAGTAYPPVTAGQITAEMIHQERLVELFNEADRINYLRGLKMDIPKGTRGEGTDPYNSEIFVWPLPQSEVIYNESING